MSSINQHWCLVDSFWKLWEYAKRHKLT